MKLTINDITIIRDHYGASGRWWTLWWNPARNAYVVDREDVTEVDATDSVEAAGETRIVFDVVSQRAKVYQKGTWRAFDQLLEDD